MADFSALIAQIEAYVKQNGNNEITGNGLQSILVGMVNALGTVAITALQGDLADEVTARTNADGTLQQGINTERQQRQDADSAINAKIPAEASSSNKLADKAFVTGLTTALQNAVNAIKADIENGYVYAGIATPSGTPVSGKVYYLARQAGTYTNFGGLTLTEGVNVLKYNGTAWSQEQLISMADIYKNPLMGYYECDTAGATAAKTVAATGYVLPTTGGSVKIKMANRNTVANATLNINSTGAKPLYYNGTRAGVGNTWDTNEVIEVYYDGTNYQAYNVAGSKGGGVFDISAWNLTNGQPSTYEDLEAALGTNGEHVPAQFREPGMQVKFIRGTAPSVDNKYVQCRCMAPSFTTDTTQWQVVETEPTTGSKNLVDSNGILSSLKLYSKLDALYIHNGTMNAAGALSESTTRLITSYIYTDSNITITAATNYKIKYIRKTFDLIVRENVDWAQTITLTGRENSLYVILIKRDSDAVIVPEDFNRVVSADFTGCKFYEITESLEMNLNSLKNSLGIYNKTKDLCASNTVINTSGNYSFDVRRVSTGLILTANDVAVTASEGYRFRVTKYNRDLTFVSQTDFVTSYTLSANYSILYCITIFKDETNPLNPANISNYISADFSQCEIYLSPEQIRFAINNILGVGNTSQATESRKRLGFGDGTFDSFPVPNGDNMVKSRGVFVASKLFSKIDNIYVTNGVYNSSGVFVENAFRLATCFIRCSTDVVISAKTGYQFRVHIYSKQLSHDSNSNWQTSATLTGSDTRYYTLDIMRTDGNYIHISDMTNAIESSFTNCEFYVNANLLNPLYKLIDKVSELDDNFNINRNLTGLTDMEWEYQNWVFPQAISYNGIRNCLYFTFTNQAGFSGIACYDYETGLVTKNFLKKNEEVDDHNLIAVLMMSNRKLLCAFSGGHNTDTYIHTRISSSQESIENFEDDVRIQVNNATSYAQLFEYNNKIFLFYRIENVKWGYSISEDFGRTWSQPVVIVTTPSPQYQYYCQFTETTTAGVLRLCCYSNPSEDDTNIRLAFLHLYTMTLYSSDNETVLGTSNVLCTNIPIIIPTPTGKKLRLHNAAKTAINDTKVLYCEFSTASDSDGEYKIYDNGQTVKIVDAGMHLFLKVQLGAAWIGDSQVVVARGENNMDIVEIWDYNNGQCTFNRTITSHSRITDVTQDYRTGRPMVDNHQQSVLYLQGYYEPISFQNFEQDAHIYNLTNNNQQG